MKSFKPKTPSLRQTTVVDYKKVLTRGEPEKSLTHGFRRSVGRNNRGRKRRGIKAGELRGYIETSILLWTRKISKPESFQLNTIQIEALSLGLSLFVTGRKDIW